MRQLRTLGGSPEGSGGVAEDPAALTSLGGRVRLLHSHVLGDLGRRDEAIELLRGLAQDLGGRLDDSAMAAAVRVAKGEAAEGRTDESSELLREATRLLSDRVSQEVAGGGRDRPLG